jgi:hypothetical protein
LKEKLSILLHQLNPHKQQRAWTDLEDYKVRLTAFFDHFGTGRAGDEILRSFDQSEVHSSRKGFFIYNTLHLFTVIFI